MLPSSFDPPSFPLSAAAAGHPKTRLELEALVDSLSAEVRLIEAEFGREREREDARGNCTLGYSNISSLSTLDLDEKITRKNKKLRLLLLSLSLSLSLSLPLLLRARAPL